MAEEVAPAPARSTDWLDASSRSPAMQALCLVVRSYTGASVHSRDDEYSYRPPIHIQDGDVPPIPVGGRTTVPFNDAGGLTHEIAHWVVGGRGDDDYGLGAVGTLWRDFHEVWASALACYWMVKAGRGASAPSIDTCRWLPSLETSTRFWEACRHMRFFLSLCPPGLSDSVILALRLPGGDSDYVSGTNRSQTEAMSLDRARHVIARWQKGLKPVADGAPPYASRWCVGPSALPKGVVHRGLPTKTRRALKALRRQMTQKEMTHAQPT